MFFILLMACTDPEESSTSVQSSFDLGEVIPNAVVASIDSQVEGVVFIEWGTTADNLRTTRPAPIDAGGRFEGLVIGPPSGERVSFRAVVQTASGERLEGALETLDIPYEPAEIPNVDTVGTLPGDAPGHVFTSLITAQTTELVILNEEGRPVWFVKLPSNELVTASSLARDGSGVLVLTTDMSLTAPQTVILHYAWDGRVLRRMVLPDGHHDFVELPDGRIAWIQLEAGPITISGEAIDVAQDALRVSSWAETADVTQPPLFSFLRDWTGPDGECDHQRHTLFYQGRELLDWTHANSLDYDATQDAFLMLTHHIDQAFVISAKDGALLNQIRFEEGDPMVDEGEPWSHAHSSTMSADRLLLFDNGLHYSPPRSRVVAYDVDAETGALTETLSLWEAEERLVFALGDVKELPNDELLTSWSTLGRITRTSATGEELWALETSAGAGTGRIEWMAELP
ncbi:MAG: hypothetical protein RIT28_3492 [Pseudomonadota bacterium]